MSQQLFKQDIINTKVSVIHPLEDIAEFLGGGCCAPENEKAYQCIKYLVDEVLDQAREWMVLLEDRVQDA